MLNGKQQLNVEPTSSIYATRKDRQASTLEYSYQPFLRDDPLSAEWAFARVLHYLGGAFSTHRKMAAIDDGHDGFTVLTNDTHTRALKLGCQLLNPLLRF